MENTSCGENCCYVKSGFCNNETECPNYLEQAWSNSKTGEMKVVKDCAPKRMAFNQSDIIHRQLVLQKALEEQRNKFDILYQVLRQLIEKSREVINEASLKKLELDFKDE